MRHSLTREIIKSIQKYLKDGTVSVGVRSTEWHDRNHESDKIVIDNDSSVGFEVFEDEIIVYFFSDHYHYEDYSYVLDEDDPTFSERATALIKGLLTSTVSLERTFKGSHLVSERYIFIDSDGKNASPIGAWKHHFFLRINPFVQKRIETKTWRYNKETGKFVRF